MTDLYTETPPPSSHDTLDNRPGTLTTRHSGGGRPGATAGGDRSRQGGRTDPPLLAAGNDRNDIIYRPIVDASPYVMVVAWRAGTRSRAVAAFVRTAIDASAADPVHGPTEIGTSAA